MAWTLDADRPIYTQLVEKIQMDIAVIIGQRTLLAMTNSSSQNSQQPNIDAPISFRIKRHSLIHQTQTDGHVDGKEPQIARKTVQHTSPLSLLSGQPCQLTVGTIVMIGPHQKKNPQQRMCHIGIIEHESCPYAQKDGQDSYHVGVYM